MMAVSIFSVRNTLRRSDTPPHPYSLRSMDEGVVMFVGSGGIGVDGAEIKFVADLGCM